MIAAEHITGLVLAGGRGSRMGGVDKGLQFHRGRTLAANAMRRLAPQVGPLAINANRHLAIYGALGAPVWTDPPGESAGPLAGFRTGLQRCATPYLATVPCDAPLFPHDLVTRLAAALEARNAQIAMAVACDDTSPSPQPVFCLMSREVRPSLEAFFASGRRRAAEWIASLRGERVLFEDAPAFANLNTVDELASAEDRYLAT